MCILPFSLNRKYELLRVNLTVKQRLPDFCWKESAAHMWVPKRGRGRKSKSGHFLKMTTISYLVTLSYEVSLWCVKASNCGVFYFLNPSLITTKFNFNLLLTLRMQELSFLSFKLSFPFVRSTECWNHKRAKIFTLLWKQYRQVAWCLYGTYFFLCSNFCDI